MGGCNTTPRLQFTPAAPSAEAAPPRPETGQPRTGVKVLIDQPQAPAPSEPLTDDEVARLVPDRSIAVMLPPQPLHQFIDTLFGQVLNIPYVTGPGVSRRTDIVSLNGPAEMSGRQLFRLAELALGHYGLRLTQADGAVLVAHARAPAASSGELPAAPGQTEPRSLYVSGMDAVQVGPASELLGEMFPNRDEVEFATDPRGNALLIAGDEAAVRNAAAAAMTIDQPEFAGMQVARITPVLWTADAMATALRDILAKEGFVVGSGAGDSTALMTLGATGGLLLFSDDQRLFSRVLYWARQLDSLDGAGGEQAGYFVYQVRNSSAAELGGLVARASGEGESGSAPSDPRSGDKSGDDGTFRSTAARADGLPGNAANETAGGRITIDSGGNRILFRGKRREYAELYQLLRELDVAPRQVLVEITIAEVALTDETRFGLEWFLDGQLGKGDFQVSSQGGLAREDGGIGITYARSFKRFSVEAALNAIATNQNLNILSTPRLVARSGGQAQILIGNDVPIITSQRAADIQSSGDTDVLQTVQYRQTGVILNIRPVVLNDDRVDIEIFQEVSSQQPNVTSAIASPVISNRSVSTRLTLREGMTAVLGGMIQDSQSRGQRGVPLLKDIPLLGQAFRTDSANSKKTELVILVTPRIIRDDQQYQAITASQSGSLNSLMMKRGAQVYTLLPWSLGSLNDKHSPTRPN